MDKGKRVNYGQKLYRKLNSKINSLPKLEPEIHDKMVFIRLQISVLVIY